MLANYNVPCNCANFSQTLPYSRYIVCIVEIAAQSIASIRWVTISIKWIPYRCASGKRLQLWPSFGQSHCLSNRNIKLSMSSLRACNAYLVFCKTGCIDLLDLRMDPGKIYKCRLILK